jgi:hypothetical protein
VLPEASVRLSIASPVRLHLRLKVLRDIEWHTATVERPTSSFSIARPKPVNVEVLILIPSWTVPNQASCGRPLHLKQIERIAIIPSA